MNYYETLGVPENADISQIKSAYKELAKKYHPDVSSEPDAEEKFKGINEAYDTLGNDEKRRLYDQKSKGDPFDFNDLFFRNFNPYHPFNRVERVMPNSDIHLRHALTLEDTLNPIDLTIKYDKLIMCDACSGKGGLEETICSNCNGQGVITQHQYQGMIAFSQTSPCGACRGTGRIYKKPCGECHSTGYKTHTAEETVHIPVGQVGKRMIFPGKGNLENKSAPPGMLTLDIGILDHPLYRIESLDSLVYSIEIDPVEAMLGGEFYAKSIDGTVVPFKIPKGCPNGYREEFKELGIPVSETRRGALYAEIVHKMPSTLSEEQENALKLYLANKKND